MEPLRLLDLATATGGRLVAADPECWCTGIGTDSREIPAGGVFWALRGPRFDGHDFAAQALERGARLVVCEQNAAGRIAAPKLIVDDTLLALGRLARWYRKRLEALVIGVTGSVGKTTTKELIYSVLSTQYSGVRSPGNFNNLVGLPKSLLAISAADEFAVLEFGASAIGDIRRLSEIAAPEVGVITSIGKAHLATFGSLQGVAQAKGELVEALPASGFAVLPGDDPLARGLSSRVGCRVLLVGEQSENDVRAVAVDVSPAGLSFQVEGNDLFVPAAPRHFLTNALIAVAIARELGVPADRIAAGLRAFQPEAGRCQVHRGRMWTVIDDTYNASPTSVAAACDWLSTYPVASHGRRYLVLGDMLELGGDAGFEHFEIGRRAAAGGIQGVLAFGEQAAEVARGAASGGLPPGRIVATSDLAVLQTVLDCWVEPGDVVLVKGSRGMRMERVVSWLKDSEAQRQVENARRCA